MSVDIYDGLWVKSIFGNGWDVKVGERNCKTLQVFMMTAGAPWVKAVSNNGAVKLHNCAHIEGMNLYKDDERDPGQVAMDDFAKELADQEKRGE